MSECINININRVTCHLTVCEKRRYEFDVEKVNTTTATRLPVLTAAFLSFVMSFRNGLVHLYYKKSNAARRSVDCLTTVNN